MQNNQPVTVFLGLGSNLGDRQHNLEMAIKFISERIKIEKISPFYETEPVGDTNQPRFLNMALEVSTRLSAQTLLVMVKGIEAKLGRVPIGSPRPIDIDILFYGSEVINTPPELIVPHPRLVERAFVLAPLTDIAPDLIHPVNKKPVKEMFDEVAGKQGVIRLGELAESLKKE